MAFNLNSTPTDAMFPSKLRRLLRTGPIPDRYNVFAKKKNPGLGAITLKVFGPRRLNGAEMIAYGELDRSKGLCEQISQFIYFDDWKTVEVVRGAPHFDRKRINLELIEWIQDERNDQMIYSLMYMFKNQFNVDCEKAIAELWRDDAKVWLEVAENEKIPENEARKTFETIDSNQDMKISQVEYFKALRPSFKPPVAKILGLDVVNGQESNERTVAQMKFDAIDINQDKFLSWDEFRAVYAGKPATDETLWNQAVNYRGE
jgi:hypothetical protein